MRAGLPRKSCQAGYGKFNAEWTFPQRAELGAVDFRGRRAYLSDRVLRIKIVPLRPGNRRIEG